MDITYTRMIEALTLRLGRAPGRGELPKLIGETSQTINNWRTRGLSQAAMVNLNTKFGISTSYIQHGRMPVFSTEGLASDQALAQAEPQRTVGLPGTNAREASGATFRICQYDTGGKMGVGGVILRDQPGEIRSWDVSEEWLRKNVPTCSSPNNLAIVTGFGDSMRPLYNPGDPLLIDIGVKTVDFDAIYFFRVGDEGFIKRIQRIPGNGLVAISENRSYRDWTITGEMDFEVFGRVVKIWKGDDF